MSAEFLVILHPLFKATRCSAVGSVPGLGPGCRRFESCHLDHPCGKSPLTYNKLADFLLLSPYHHVFFVLFFTFFSYLCSRNNKL